MKFTDFISIIVNPIWKWGVEIFMGVMSVIIYVKPEWTDWLSFSKLIKDYWVTWFIIGTLIWIFATAWQYAKEKAEMRKAIGNVEKSRSFQNHIGSGNNQMAENIYNTYGDLEIKKKTN